MKDKNRKLYGIIGCEECGQKYTIYNDEADNYNIYFKLPSNSIIPQPHLLCPICTDVVSRENELVF